MPNNYSAESPQTKIATAQASFALALRLNSEILSGRIRETIYEREVVIITGGAGLLLPPDYRVKKNDLKDGVFNLVIMALGATALTTDETLDEVFGKPKDDLELNRKGLRVLVNQMRNAFAHNPWQPKWQIRPTYQSIYQVNLGENASFTFDATSLDGKNVKPEDIGGLESWVKVLKHCESIVPA
jgi:organic radical activating enzyme